MSWEPKTYMERSFSLGDSYEITEFTNGKDTMGLYETGEFIDELLKLLQEAHDWIDELNNQAPGEPGNNSICYVCHQTGYDTQGLKHTDNCILIRIRHELSRA